MTPIKQYEFVSAIATHGGVSQAAETLGISQPSLSKHLKKLEEELGISLFDRSTIPLRLTEAGLLFLETGQRMLDLDRQFQKRLSQIKDEGNTLLRIGISPSRAPYMLPPLLSAYRDKNPNAKVIIEERTSSELSRHLSQGELDMIISLLDEDTEGFVRIPLFREHMLLAVPSDAPYRDANSAIRALPLITVGQGQALWKTANRIVGELHAPPASTECQSIESGLALVKRGLGTMLVPSYISDFDAKEQSGLRFLPLPDAQALAHTRDVCLFYRKDQFLTRAENDFVLCLDNIKSIS